MTTTHRLTLGLLLVAGACHASCDGLAASDFRGEPLLTFEGQIAALGRLPGAEGSYKVSIFWVPGVAQAPANMNRLQELAAAHAAGLLHEQPEVSVEVTFPASFVINIFTAPRAEVLAQPHRRWGLALILVYRDADADGVYTAGVDDLVGGADIKGLLYAPAPVSAEDSPTNQALTAGYHRVQLPLPCDLQPFPAETGTEDCGVPLGGACAGDSACGPGGVCLQNVEGEVYPGGYCALPVSADGCTPAGSNIIWYDDEAYYARYCTEVSDCRTDEGYTCDSLMQVCFPDLPVALFLTEEWCVDTLCLTEEVLATDAFACDFLDDGLD